MLSAVLQLNTTTDADYKCISWVAKFSDSRGSNFKEMIFLGFKPRGWFRLSEISILVSFKDQ